MGNNFEGEQGKCLPITNQPKKITIPGMDIDQDTIQKYVYETENAYCSSIMSLITNEVHRNYPEQEAQTIIETVLNSEDKFFKQFDKKWLIFAVNEESLCYFGFLKRKKQGMHLLGTYEFRINFTLKKDISVKNQTSYPHNSSFFRGSSTKYVSIDHTEQKSRGICGDDIKKLCKYVDLMEMEFKEISF